MSKRIDTLDNESGQTMAEYGVVLGVITVFIITALSLLAGGFEEAFERTTELIELVI
jgi:Flp pilus assembly pilin Flp